MNPTRNDPLVFFDKHISALPLYEAFEKKLYEEYPESVIQVQKTQIAFSSRHVFACVSFQRVKPKAELPNPYLTVTVGLSYPLASSRVAAKTEPYPGRWTTHIIVGELAEIDDELFSWVRQAYDFAERK